MYSTGPWLLEVSADLALRPGGSGRGWYVMLQESKHSWGKGLSGVEEKHVDA